MRKEKRKIFDHILFPDISRPQRCRETSEDQGHSALVMNNCDKPVSVSRVTCHVSQHCLSATFPFLIVFSSVVRSLGTNHAVGPGTGES